MTGPKGPKDTDAARRRAELGHFLRVRRGRLDPVGLGLPIGPRRRVSGLLREEVAALAGLSTTWYTYLEQGRDIHPSPDVLDTVAVVLGLDDDERRYLRRLAFGSDSAMAPLTGLGRIDLDPAAVVAALGRGSDPFYATTQNSDIVAWNAAVTTWFTDFGAMAPDRRNVLRWMVTDPVARERLPLWENEVRDVLGRMRANIPARPPDPTTEPLVAELREHSSVFRRLWDEHYVVDHRARYRQMFHPRHGVRTFRLVVLRAADDSDLIYIAHLPVGEDVCPPQFSSSPARVGED